MHGPLTQIGPYQVIRRIGQGGMAEVYLARAFGASGFEKLCAIKILLPELRGQGEPLRGFIAEARLGARLQHRNLVAVHDLAVDEGIYYMRLDYVDGGDLFTLCKRRRPSPALAILIIEEIACALDYLHRFTDEAGRPLGLIHRDISPANILLSQAGDVKLADFGVAKATLLKSATQGNIRKGKYAYMSPEQVMAEPLGPRSDQFSLGVTLFELLTGQRPFDGEGVADTLERIRSAKPPDLSAIPDELHPALTRCLKQRPEDRYPDMEALRLSLRGARAGLTQASTRDLGSWVRVQLADKT